MDEQERLEAYRAALVAGWRLPFILWEKEIVILAGSSIADEYEPEPHEVVVQLNHHVTRRSSRCDWLILRKSCQLTPERFRLECPQSNAVKIITPAISTIDFFRAWERYANERKIHCTTFFNRGFLGVNPYHPSLEWNNEFLSTVGTDPFLGVLAAKMISRLPVSRIKLIGFDFYGGNSEMVGVHNVRKNLAALYNMWRYDYRFVADRVLLETFARFYGSGFETKRGLIDASE